MNVELKANQAYPVTISGSWVWLKQAAAPIVLETVIGERVMIHKGSVIKNDALLGRVLLHSDIEQLIEIEFGKGDFQPPTDGQRVVVDSLPEMQIAPDQSVNVGSLPAVTLAEGQSVAVSTLPAMELADGQSLAVSALPAVELAAGQHITTTVSGLLVPTSGAMPLTLAANDSRRTVHIKAAKTNVNPILIAGVYPLEAGECIELDTRAEIALTGDAADSAVILEC